MKIILINPPVYDFSAYDVWIKPLGILYLSNILKKHNFEIVLLDCLDRNFFLDKPVKENGTGKYPYEVVQKPSVLSNIPLRYKRYGVSKKIIEDFLLTHKDARYVIVTSCMSYWYLGVEEIIDTVKRLLPESKIILGGTYPVIMPEHAKSLFSSKVALISCKPGFYEVLDYLDIPEKEYYNSFENFPAPDYTLYKRVWYVVLRLSYGCGNRCTYCATGSIFSDYQVKDIKKVVKEIIELYNLTNCQNFVFYDDYLPINKRYFLDLFKELSKLNLKIKFFTPNGINPKLISKETAILLKQLNFIDPRLSLETVSNLTHNLVDKKVFLKDFEEALKNLVLAGYNPNEISVYLLAGLPGETIEDVYNSINIMSAYKVRIRLSELSIVPKSKLFYDLNLDETVDPLLYNNTIFLFHGIPGKIKPWCNFEEMQQLKNHVKEINSKINVLDLKESYV